MAIILVRPKLLKRLTGGRATAIALFPFIIVQSEIAKTNPTLLNHEYIHLRQQAELGILPFYIWYLTEFLIKWIYYRNFNTAYLNICFEKEAYSHEDDEKYLSTRRLLNFIRFL